MGGGQLSYAEQLAAAPSSIVFGIAPLEVGLDIVIDLRLRQSDRTFSIELLEGEAVHLIEEIVHVVLLGILLYQVHTTIGVL